MFLRFACQIILEKIDYRGHQQSSGGPSNLQTAHPEETRQLKKSRFCARIRETHILGCFLKNDEFGLGDCHALGLEQQVAEIPVAVAPAKWGFDVRL
jgi:hypothetical protein